MTHQAEPKKQICLNTFGTEIQQMPQRPNSLACKPRMHHLLCLSRIFSYQTLTLIPFYWRLRASYLSCRLWLLEGLCRSLRIQIGPHCSRSDRRPPSIAQTTSLSFQICAQVECSPKIRRMWICNPKQIQHIGTP